MPAHASKLILAISLLLGSSLRLAAAYLPSAESPPPIAREFRGAWVAVVYNIDWPSKPGLSRARQGAELKGIMDEAVKLGLNAIIFQVRPAGDAVYASKREPWAHWLTGKADGNPGYDPLAEAIQLAHQRGLELHAWFNPFRAQANLKHPLARRHAATQKPPWIKTFRESQWFDPASPQSRRQALNAIMDVVRRYDIDGVHLDDYFYPYPRTKNGRALDSFPDGDSYDQYRSKGGRLSLADWRRSQVNLFVKALYSTVKREKRWVRVGISPFGIWRPGVPAGIEAGLDCYDHLFADSRRWLREGWCDYLAPQLYWRDGGPQSFSRLLGWWRAQSSSRPVWPGIATSRIESSEDPGRPASEMLKQIDLTRKIGRQPPGHIHWSMKALMQNRGNISRQLPGRYRSPALTPPMPWLGRSAPAKPKAVVRTHKDTEGGFEIHFQPGERGSGVRKWVLQTQRNGKWRVEKIIQGPYSKLFIPGRPQGIALTAVNGYGATSPPCVFELRR